MKNRLPATVPHIAVLNIRCMLLKCDAAHAVPEPFDESSWQRSREGEEMINIEEVRSQVSAEDKQNHLN